MRSTVLRQGRDNATTVSPFGQPRQDCGCGRGVHKEHRSALVFGLGMLRDLFDPFCRCGICHGAMTITRHRRQ